jgi:glycosyltransferase involved in cell wall biosynthesis
MWELLLVDNASEKILSLEIDLSWHPQACHIRENELGLTPARLRGIQEAQAETLVFVDDDNVLDLDFLDETLRISKDFPFVGVWGGKIRPEFEIIPPDWTKRYWGMLAIRDFEKDRWSNLIEHIDTCGAGMCVRKIVAKNYADSLSKDQRRISLDRKGKLLTSCGDSDIGITACAIGLGTGQFTSLGLTHLIPASRLEENYLLSLVKGIAYSGTILASIWNIRPVQTCRSQQIYQTYTRWRMGSRHRRFYDASVAGKNLALIDISNGK